MENHQLRIAGVVNDSIVDGPGYRFTIFTQGCPHRCPGCHNPQTHDPRGGSWIDTDELMGQILENPLLEVADVLVDGPFILEERDLELSFRGSRNQRLIDLPASLVSGQAVMAVI